MVEHCHHSDLVKDYFFFFGGVISFVDDFDCADFTGKEMLSLTNFTVRACSEDFQISVFLSDVEGFFLD